MTIPNRTVSIKSVFASTANTTIPTPPAPGISYRNTGTTAAEIGEGWPFKEVVDSAKFNQAMYEYTTICQQVEKYGFLPWSANTDYPAQGCALGSDGKIYQAKQATGPSSTSKDPTTDTSHTYWDLFYYADVTANRALVSNANGKMAASSVTATELGFLSGVTSSIQTQINNRAANNAVVHLAGDETIAGTKTFNNYLLLKKTFDDFSITPQNPIYTEIRNVDINGNEIGQFRVWKDTDGANVVDLLGRYQDNSVDIYGAALGIKSYSDGRSFSYAPASDASGSIVTTAGINKSKNGYVKLGNGLIVQWGELPIGTTQLTFPIPFTSDNVTVCPIAFYNSSSQVAYYDISTAGCKIYPNRNDYVVKWLAIGY